ncbi:hypothetical protein DFH06DRAFT_723894 [Mycena polygramma]|nr:hypothetical protein DFH06DRAFT_723894 [Mycena polygramma]
MLAASAREIKSAASQNNCWWSSGSLGAGSFIPALVSSTLCFLWEFYSPRLLNLWLLHPEIGLLISFFAVDVRTRARARTPPAPTCFNFSSLQISQPSAFSMVNIKDCLEEDCVYSRVTLACCLEFFCLP